MGFLAGVLPVAAAADAAADGTRAATATPRLDKVERSLGLGLFSQKGYQPMLVPGVSFIKRKRDRSEVIQYTWRPMIIRDMPHHERIDRILCSYNLYFYAGREKRVFYGAGVGGNVILFSDKLKDWAKDRNIHLSDGVNGMGRLFVGYKLSEVKALGTVWPVVLRVDAFLGPAYKFGGELGRAGDRLELTEVKAGLGFSIE